MSYNKDTDWDNERAYLNNLIANGSAGEKAWAKNQLGVLNNAMKDYAPHMEPKTPTTPIGSPIYTKTPTTPSITTNPLLTQPLGTDPTAALGALVSQATDNKKNTTGSTYTPLGTHNDSGLSAEDKAAIEDLQKLYADAIANGDTAAADKAHTDAEEIRSGYGYSGGADGSEYIALGTPTVPSNNGLSSSDILSWNGSYNTSNPQPTYTEPTVGEKTLTQAQLDLLNEILTREDFSYDVENDPLYAQYKTMYNREGDRAMRDTLAEAAASAGGMNSYAITAAQQANNYYASQLNDRIPELYQLAYEMYLQDKESKVQDLGLLFDMDDKQYSRYRDTMNDWRADKDFAYGTFSDAVSQGNWEKNYDFNEYWTNKEWTASEQDKAKDELLELISLGGTPSADLMAKAGVDQSYVDLAMAAYKAGNNNSNNNNNNGNNNNSNNNSNGYTGNEVEPDDTTPTITIADIEKDLNSYISNGAQKAEIREYLRKAKDSGVITKAQYDKLLSVYAPQGHLY